MLPSGRVAVAGAAVVVGAAVVAVAVVAVALLVDPVPTGVAPPAVAAPVTPVGAGCAADAALLPHAARASAAAAATGRARRRGGTRPGLPGRSGWEPPWHSSRAVDRPTPPGVALLRRWPAVAGCLVAVGLGAPSAQAAGPVDPPAPQRIDLHLPAHPGTADLRRVQALVTDLTTRSARAAAGVQAAATQDLQLRLDLQTAGDRAGRAQGTASRAVRAAY